MGSVFVRSKRYINFFVAAMLSIFTGEASDLGTEFVPPVCLYGDNGAAFPGQPSACDGNFRILGVTTAHLITDPGYGDWQLTESISDIGLRLQFQNTFGSYEPANDDPYLWFLRGNPTGSSHAFARFFSLTVTNAGTVPWAGFYFEVRVAADVPSDHGDSLSFGQVAADECVLHGGVPTSDAFQFSASECVVDAKDALTFRGGFVAPEQEATFRFLISANQTEDFYLVQQPLFVPEPASALLCFAGLLTLLKLRIIRNRWRTAPADSCGKLKAR